MDRGQADVTDQSEHHGDDNDVIMSHRRLTQILQHNVTQTSSLDSGEFCPMSASLYDNDERFGLKCTRYGDGKFRFNETESSSETE